MLPALRYSQDGRIKQRGTFVFVERGDIILHADDGAYKSTIDTARRSTDEATDATKNERASSWRGHLDRVSVAPRGLLAEPRAPVPR